MGRLGHLSHASTDGSYAAQGAPACLSRERLTAESHQEKNSLHRVGTIKTFLQSPWPCSRVPACQLHSTGHLGHLSHALTARRLRITGQPLHIGKESVHRRRVTRIRFINARKYTCSSSDPLSFHLKKLEQRFLFHISMHA